MVLYLGRAKGGVRVVGAYLSCYQTDIYAHVLPGQQQKVVNKKGDLFERP